MKYYFKCTTCGKKYSENFRYLCHECEANNNENEPPKGVLETVYDYEKITKNFVKLQKNGFIDLLPIKSLKSLPNLRVGETPLYSYNKFENETLDYTLLLKDDSQNPTFSFKDRASALVSAYAKENNISTIVAASTGNAGSSIAGICAAQNQKAIIYVPESAPKAKLTQIKMYGAKLITVNGNYDKAFDLSIEATKKHGYFNRNTAYNPFTIEGKKTVSYELFAQMNQQIPTRIFVSVGDGVIISGVYKGYEDLLKLGFIDKMPTIVTVQAKGSNNIIANIETEKFISKPAKTIADSISVDIPRNFYMTKKFIKQYKGEHIEVTDNEIISASKKLSKNTGIFSEPAASTAFAGFLLYKNQNKLEKNTKNVVLLTGNGLKDLEAVRNIE